MARGVNKVILVGNLGRDPEVKYTQSGMAVTSFSLATTQVRKDREGNTREETQWHTVKAFGKLGEIAGEYLAQGRQVYVEGEIRYSKVETESGTRYYTDIVANELQFLGGGGGEGGQGGRSAPTRAAGGRERGGGGRQAAERPTSQRETRQAGDQYGGGFPDDGFADDDIPF